METGGGTDILTQNKNNYLRSAYYVPGVPNTSHTFAHVFPEQLYGVGSIVVLYNYCGTSKLK